MPNPRQIERGGERSPDALASFKIRKWHVVLGGGLLALGGLLTFGKAYHTEVKLSDQQSASTDGQGIAVGYPDTVISLTDKRIFPFGFKGRLGLDYCKYSSKIVKDFKDLDSRAEFEAIRDEIHSCQYRFAWVNIFEPQDMPGEDDLLLAEVSHGIVTKIERYDLDCFKAKEITSINECLIK